MIRGIIRIRRRRRIRRRTRRLIKAIILRTTIIREISI